MMVGGDALMWWGCPYDGGGALMMVGDRIKWERVV